MSRSFPVRQPALIGRAAAWCLVFVVASHGSVAANAAQSATSCSDVFDNGVSAHEPGLKVTFHRDAQLVNAPTSLLNFGHVAKDKQSVLPTCETVDCSAGNTVAASLDPGPFQTSSSALDFVAPTSGTRLVQSQYADVTVLGGATLDVEPAISTYRLDLLEVQPGATVILQPGDYWIDDLKLKSNSNLVVAGAGTARIYVNKIEVGNDALVNSTAPGISGDPSKLFVHVYDDNVKLSQDATFSGFLYGEKKIDIEQGASLFGGLSAAKDVKLKADGVVSYDAAGVLNADFGCLCSCVANLLDHFRIGASAIGIICEPQTITVTAYLDDGTVYDAYDGTVDLSTSTGVGDWLLVAGAGALTPGAPDSGNATYVFEAADLGQVVLGLAHGIVGVVNIDVDDGTGISELSNSAPPDDPDIDMRVAALRFYANGVSDAIGPQIAGKASNALPGAQTITLRAVAAGTDTNECESRLPVGTHSIELGYECIDPAVCSSANGLTVNGSPSADNDAGPVVKYVPVDLVFSMVGGNIEALLGLTHFDAGRTTLHARKVLPNDALGPNVTLLGASNAFVARPFALGFVNIVGGGSPNPGGNANGGSGFVAAGAPFAFDVAAFGYDPADDLDQDGVMDPGSDPTDNGITPAFSAPAALQIAAITPAGGSVGAFAPAILAPAAFVNGVAPVPIATYAEAGSITLRASSLDYLGDPAADVVGTSTNIGRFFPAYFELLLSGIVPSCAVGPNPFTYMGEPGLGIAYTLLARSQGGQTTLNYDSGLGYLTGLVRLHAEDSDSGVDLSARLTASPGTWRLGGHRFPVAGSNYAVSDAVFARAAVPDGPFSSLQVGLSVINEPDARQVSALDMNPDTAGNCGATSTCTAARLGLPVAARYGRLRSVAAYGPETANLNVPIVTEYLSGAGFVLNGDDGDGATACSRIPQASLDLQSGSSLGTPIPIGAGVTTGAMSYTIGPDFFLSSGDATLVLTAPGAGNTGRVSVDVDLTSAPWLQYDWTGNGSYDDDPLTTWAIFGRFRGHDRIIYWIERR